MYKKLLPAVLFFLACLPAPGLCSTTLSDRWGEIHDNLESILELIDDRKDAPDWSLIPFRQTQKTIRGDMEDLIDEVISHLGVTDFSELKQDINECRGRITSLNKKIATLKAERLLAPESVSSWKIFTKDMEDYDEDIRDYEEKVRANEAAIAENKSILLDKLHESGIDIDQEQLDVLVFSVTGDDDLELISVFHNVKIITGKLRDLTFESNENIDTAKKYYGMHTVLLKILLVLQGHYLDKVETAYLPTIDSIIQENRELMARTRELLGSAPAEHKPMYRANLEAQQLTDKTAELYKRYLRSNMKRVGASIASIQKEYQVAENTYNTVNTAYALISVMAASDQFFQALSELQVPDLLRFENADMRNEFMKLTQVLSDKMD